MNVARDPILKAKAGLQTSICALLDSYPKAVADGRTEAWLKAVVAIAEYYAHIHEHGIDGLGNPPPKEDGGVTVHNALVGHSTRTMCTAEATGQPPFGERNAITITPGKPGE